MTANDASVEVSEEQRNAAHALMATFDRYCSCDEDGDPEAMCDNFARLLAERDHAAELRGAEREREVWLAKIDECFPPDVQAAIRARGK